MKRTKHVGVIKIILSVFVDHTQAAQFFCRFIGHDLIKLSDLEGGRKVLIA